MLEILNTVTPSPDQWYIIIEGMRNPMNSWDKSDSDVICVGDMWGDPLIYDFDLGDADLGLMKRLNAGGAVHAKYRRMIPVFVTINAPLYWWKEFDTYKVGTVCNSCSTMHKIHAKEFTLDDFSVDHLDHFNLNLMNKVIHNLNHYRKQYLETKDKGHWWQMIQLLPTCYNQRRTIMLNYEVLANMYYWRKDHKLDEWHTFCDWICDLPYSALITGDEQA